MPSNDQQKQPYHAPAARVPRVKQLKPDAKKRDSEVANQDRAAIEIYQAFMAGYVQRINAATFNVTIGGVRIGSAKYSRLAQINLQSRIITFSRFAVENVPERGRRYLVLHELAHVKEANHNKRFWQHVELYEPNYKQISRDLELAFKRNVREEQNKLKSLQIDSPFADPNRIPGSGLFKYKTHRLADVYNVQDEQSAASEDDSIIVNPNDDAEDGSFDCMEKDFSLWDEPGQDGIVNGGSEIIQLTLSFD